LKKRVHIKVHGRVQGVFYRVSTKEVAEKLGITGYVINMPDRSVEIDAEGSEKELLALIDWSKQGPPYSQVDKIELKWIDKLENYRKFTIKRTAWY